jgi:uncharacterized protein
MEWKYEGRSIYCIDNNGELTAEATFNFIDNNLVDIDHTYVNPSLRGQGIAAELMKAVMEYIKAKGLKVTASCSYANAWLRKNKEEYSDIISEGLFDQEISCRIDG